MSKNQEEMIDFKIFNCIPIKTATNKQKLKLRNNTTYNSINTMKYLGMCLTKDAKDLYIKNYKTSQKKITED